MKIIYQLSTEVIADLLTNGDPILEIDRVGWMYYYFIEPVTISPSPEVAWIDRWPVAYLALELAAARHAVLFGQRYSIAFTEAMLKINFDPTGDDGFLLISYHGVTTEQVKVDLEDCCKDIDIFLSTLAMQLIAVVPNIENNRELQPLFANKA